MHRAAFDYIGRAAALAAPNGFRSVIEIGSRDINGTVRGLFAGADYVGLDLYDGPGVDIAGDAELYHPPELVEAVICAEVLEHAPHWRELLAVAAGWLEPAGILIVTCAGPGRRPHSGIDGRRELHPDEHYANLPAGAVAAELARAGLVIDQAEELNADTRVVAHRPRPYRLDVVVPMRDNHGLSRELLRQLARDPRDFDRLWLYDNGSETPRARAWLDTVEKTGRYGAEVIRWGPERGIYRIWNDATRRALDEWRAEPTTPVYLAVLNNDLIVPAGFLRELARALHAAPPDVWVTFPDWPLGWPAEPNVTGELRRTTGTRNRGGMSGYAFLLDVRRHDTDALPYIDEEYLWLSGDGDLVTNIEDLGATAAAVVGLPVGHLEKATSKLNDWTRDQGRADMARFRALRTEKLAARGAPT